MSRTGAYWGFMLVGMSRTGALGRIILAKMCRVWGGGIRAHAVVNVHGCAFRSADDIVFSIAASVQAESNYHREGIRIMFAHSHTYPHTLHRFMCHRRMQSYSHSRIVSYSHAAIL